MSTENDLPELKDIEGLGRVAHDAGESVLLRRANWAYVLALVGCLMGVGLTLALFGHGRAGLSLVFLYAPVLSVVAIGVRLLHQQESRYTFNPPRSRLQGLGVAAIGGFESLPATTFARLTDEVQGDVRQFLERNLNPVELEIATALLVDTYDGTVAELIVTAKALAA